MDMDMPDLKAAALTQDLRRGRDGRALILNDGAAALYDVNGTTLACLFSASTKEPGWENGLGPLLADKPVVIVFNGADQSYRKEENLPDLNARDLPIFMGRKLELAFPDYLYRAWRRENPGDSQAAPAYLAGAIAKDAESRRVLKQVVSAARGAALCASAVEAVDLTRMLKEKCFGPEGAEQRVSVLVSQHPGGGLRQLVMRWGGNLVMTRCTPTPAAALAGAAWADEVLREVEGTLVYFGRLGYGPAQGPDVVVICGEEEKRHFGPQVEVNLRCLTPAEALAQLGLTLSGAAGTDARHFGDALYAGWILSTEKIKLPFPGEGLTQAASSGH